MYQAVIGSEVAKVTGLKIGDQFQVTHGLTVTPNPDVHPQKWRVVGILDKTRTANDRLMFIPLLSFYSITEHEKGLIDIAALRAGRAIPSQAASAGTSTKAAKAEPANADPERVHLVIPKKDWMLSAILVQSRGGSQAQDLMWRINNGDVATAANPASEMWQFFKQFLDVNFALLFYIALLVTIVAAVSILVSIYNSISARNREIAILRALGATRMKILTLICLEAGLIGLCGAILGLVLGHLILGSIASAYLQAYVGQGINWWTPGGEEWLYLVIVVLIAILAGLVPALKAYRTPVADNLVTA
jgi:putative ABC transport system permease protein